MFLGKSWNCEQNSREEVYYEQHIAIEYKIVFSKKLEKTIGRDKCLFG